MLALEHTKVIDMAHMAPGAYCAMILGDLGADVIRVDEPPHSDASQSDSNRAVWSFERLMQAPYEVFNRNKRSIGLNLKSERGRNVFYLLAEKADVIIEGFRPGVVNRLGVDYNTIKRLNPRIVYCSLSGYGQDGPYRDLPGHDVNYIGVAGALDLFGERHGVPSIPLNFVGDWAGGTLHGVINILTALLTREKTGKGTYLDVAYIDGVVSFLSLVAYEHMVNGVTYRRGETPFNGGFPCYSVYSTKDEKHLTLGCFEPWFWENLCHALDRPDFIPYQFDEGEKREEIFSHFRQVFATKTRDEWFDALRDKNICVGKVNTIEELFDDPQVAHRNLLVEVNHPTKGTIKHVRIGVRHDDDARFKGVAPAIGQHTKEVLAELSQSEEQIEELQKAGVVYLGNPEAC